MSKSQLPVNSSRAVTVERIERNREWLFEIMICCYRVFSLTWPASMQIYWNKRKRLHKKRVQLPEDWFGTPIWPPWRHVKTLYRYAYSWSFFTLSNTLANTDITEMKQMKKLRQTGMSASALIYAPLSNQWGSHQKRSNRYLLYYYRQTTIPSRDDVPPRNGSPVSN